MIEQIVLDVLNENKSVFDGCIGDDQFEDIAKYISDKIKTLNRKEVEKIINCSPVRTIIKSGKGKIKVSIPEMYRDSLVNQICNLAIKEEGNNSQENGY